MDVYTGLHKTVGGRSPCDKPDGIKRNLQVQRHVLATNSVPELQLTRGNDTQDTKYGYGGLFLRVQEPTLSILLLIVDRRVLSPAIRTVLRCTMNNISYPPCFGTLTTPS